MVYSHRRSRQMSLASSSVVRKPVQLAMALVLRNDRTDPCFRRSVLRWEVRITHHGVSDLVTSLQSCAPKDGSAAQRQSMPAACATITLRPHVMQLCRQLCVSLGAALHEHRHHAQVSWLHLRTTTPSMCISQRLSRRPRVRGRALGCCVEPHHSDLHAASEARLPR